MNSTTDVTGRSLNLEVRVAIVETKHIHVYTPSKSVHTLHVMQYRQNFFLGGGGVSFEGMSEVDNDNRNPAYTNLIEGE